MKVHLAPGTCRICGCTEDLPCIDPEGLTPCSWMDADRTLCNSIKCVAQVPLSELERMVRGLGFAGALARFVVTVPA